MAQSAEHAKILKELRDRYAYATNEWRETQQESRKDRKCLTPAGPWSEKDRKDREDVGRPCLSLDELGQYVNQLINDVRMNKRGVKVSPIGNGANDDTARFRADRIRHIEYRSNAQQTYTSAFENTVQGSYGFGRIKTQYISPMSHDQELMIEPFPNPDMVIPDPDFLKPDLSDCKYFFVSEKWATSEFKREFPTARITDFDAELIAQNKGWLTADSVTVCEYWTYRYSKGKLWRVLDPMTGQAKDVLVRDGEPDPSSALVAKTKAGKPVVRDVDIPSVCMYLTNGLEILDETEWPGRYIPIFGCLGKILYIDNGAGSKRQIQSMIRLARDPYMLYCYTRSTEAELIGMTPKTPFIGYVGQFRTRWSDWQTIAHEPKPYLEADPTTEATGAQVLPLPQRQPYDPAVQPLEIAAESARRAIQSAMGISPLPTSAQRRNEKSGVALEQIEKTANKGSFHFIDHYDMMIQRVGVLLDDLIPHYDDTTKPVSIRTETDEVKLVTINDPNDEKSPQVAGDHDVTLSVGPSQDSERQAVSDFVDLLVNMGDPQVFALISPLLVKLKNLGPMGDKIAELLETLQPPAARAIMNEDGAEGQIPPQITAQMQAMQQKIEEMGQMLQTEQVKQQAQLQTAQIKAASAESDSRIDAASKIQVAQIQAQADLEVARIREQGADVDRRLKLLETSLVERRDMQDREQAERHHAETMAAPVVE